MNSTVVAKNADLFAHLPPYFFSYGQACQIMLYDDVQRQVNSTITFDDNRFLNQQNIQNIGFDNTNSSNTDFLYYGSLIWSSQFNANLTLVFSNNLVYNNVFEGGMFGKLIGHAVIARLKLQPKWKAPAPEPRHKKQQEANVAAVLEKEREEQKRLEAERDLSYREMEKAIAQVKALTELIPVCSWCKKVRREEDEWLSLENYLLSHPDIRVTHGMCPTCFGNMKTDFMNDSENKND